MIMGFYITAYRLPQILAIIFLRFRVFSRLQESHY